MSNHSTNVTITWKESPNFSNTSNWFNWGNTTNYGFTLTPSYNGATYTVFLDFLEPQTVYYFQIAIVPSYHSCTTEYLPSSYYNTFTTLVEGAYVNQYGAVIRGVVYNANGQPAPAGLEVYVQCTGYNLWSQYSYTNALGAYSISPALGATGCTTNGKGYYIVEVLNSVITNPGNPSIQWPGYWNESVVIWAVQFVNFYLPLNFVSPNYIIQVADFSNANSTNGMAGWSSLSYTQTTVYTTSEKDCWSLLFWGSCSTSSEQFTASHTYTSQNGNLVISQQFWTSGTVEFAAMNRGWATTATIYVGPYGNPQFPAQQSITDWLTPYNSSPNHYLVHTWGDSGSGVLVSYQYPQTGQLTASSTQASTGVKQWSISVDVSLPGVGVGIPVAGQSWSQTSSTSYQNGLSWTITVPQGNGPVCILVYGEGGSSSGNTADDVGIWAYAPSSGACPIP